MKRKYIKITKISIFIIVLLPVSHSFGTYIGMKAAAKAPEKFVAYVGIGQVADQGKSELDSLNYTFEQAKLAGKGSLSSV